MSRDAPAYYIYLNNTPVPYARCGELRIPGTIPEDWCTHPIWVCNDDVLYGTSAAHYAALSAFSQLVPLTSTTTTVHVMVRYWGDSWTQAGILWDTENICHSPPEPKKQYASCAAVRTIPQLSPWRSTLTAIGTGGCDDNRACEILRFDFTFLNVTCTNPIFITAQPTITIIYHTPFTDILAFQPITIPTTTPAWEFEYKFRETVCLTIFPGFYQSFDVPFLGWHVDIPLPRVTICFEQYELSLRFLNIDIDNIIAIAIAASIALIILNRVWGAT
ncbi:hypothetical protein [Candidatus Caldatribacterium sp.]|uniref:hypothetical protein n=1 Tax=Candidatus Caldatribacterium sp. TaxID=2282143 RepID=UPI00383C8FD4|nr:hypothetical protein [Candidatus Caldatribacterium sp.]